MPAHPNPTVQRQRWVLARIVRHRRKALGWSAQRLATRAGCSRSSILRIEGAENSPSGDRLVLLATALGLGTADLFTDADVEPAAHESRQVAS
jgi:transcriptional regulator with XRE-family HTH domain